MIKKALISNAIYEWLNQNNIKNGPEGLQEVFNKSQSLFDYLKNHPDFADLLPANIDFQSFQNIMQEGVMKAQDPLFNMFRRNS